MTSPKANRTGDDEYTMPSKMRIQSGTSVGPPILDVATLPDEYAARVTG
jgi:hypothetical protein